MAFDLFGFTFGKKEKPQDKVESFVPKNFDDGATVVEAGGFQSGDGGHHQAAGKGPIYGAKSDGLAVVQRRGKTN